MTEQELVKTLIIEFNKYKDGYSIVNDPARRGVLKCVLHLEDYLHYLVYLDGEEDE